MTQTDFMNEEVVRRGQAVYEEQLQAQREPENKGRFLMIEVESGNYEPVLYRIGGGRC